MANIDLKFLDAVYDDDYIQVEQGLDNLIWINVSVNEEERQVLLDKSTAIKFAKTLRTEIAKIK